MCCLISETLRTCCCSEVEHWPQDQDHGTGVANGAESRMAIDSFLWLADFGVHFHLFFIVCNINIILQVCLKVCFGMFPPIQKVVFLVAKKSPFCFRQKMLSTKLVFSQVGPGTYPLPDACGKQYESDKKSIPIWSCCKKDRFPKKAGTKSG